MSPEERRRREVWTCPNGHARWPRNSIVIRARRHVDLWCSECDAKWEASDEQREILIARLARRSLERRGVIGAPPETNERGDS